MQQFLLPSPPALVLHALLPFASYSHTPFCPSLYVIHSPGSGDLIGTRYVRVGHNLTELSPLKGVGVLSDKGI